MDCRIRGGIRGKYYKKFNEKKMLLTVEYYDSEEDVELYEEVSCEYEVCPTCEGQGRHVNPSIDSHGLSSQDFYEDPDFQEDYFSGFYDVKCYECNGKRVIPIVSDPRVKKILDKLMQDDYEFEAMCEMERRMGC